MPQYLTRNETLIPDTFNLWGTTSTEKTINCNSYVLVNAGDANNSYLKLGTLGGRISLIGQVNGTINGGNGDIFLRHASSGSSILFQNSSSSNIATFTNSQTSILNNQVNSSNLTISGTLQSPLTSLLGVSIGVIDLYKGTMLSTSMPQYLTRNETILPSSFVSSSLTSLGTISNLTATNGTITNNLTISGTLQSPLTSLLGVSINVIDTYARAGVGVSGSQIFNS